MTTFYDQDEGLASRAAIRERLAGFERLLAWSRRLRESAHEGECPRCYGEGLVTCEECGGSGQLDDAEDSPSEA